MRERTSVNVSRDKLAAALEQEYETSLQEGLSADEVNRRLAENRLEYLTKEKKRSWLRSIKQECMDPLFFFLLFLSAFFLLAEETAWKVTLPTLCLLLGLKTGQAVRNEGFLRERRALFLPKAQVLRDGAYRYIDVRELVIGDIVRLRKGERTPTTVCSLLHPGVVYRKGDIFPEESGRALAVGACGFTTLQKKSLLSRMLSGSEALPFRAAELLFRHGVIVMDGARLPERAEHAAVFLDTEYFPSAWQPSCLPELHRLLRRREIPLIFFSDKSREETAGTLKQLRLLEHARDVVDARQFACYQYEDYVRQMESIRAYVGLDEEAKRMVVEAWRDRGRWLYVLSNRECRYIFGETKEGCRKNIGEREEDRRYVSGETKEKDSAAQSGQILRLGLLGHGVPDKDYYFRGRWSEGLLRLLQGEERWNLYLSRTAAVEEKALAALCILNGAMLLAGILEGAAATFHWMFLLTACLCGGLAIWKELWWLWLRRF